jgi:hypothetical protein
MSIVAAQLRPKEENHWMEAELEQVPERQEPEPLSGHQTEAVLEHLEPIE